MSLTLGSACSTHWLALKCLISSLFCFCFKSRVLIHCTKHTHEHLWCLFRCVVFLSGLLICETADHVNASFFHVKYIYFFLFEKTNPGEANSKVVMQFIRKDFFPLRPCIYYLLLGKGTVGFEMIVIELILPSLWRFIFMYFLLCFGPVLWFTSENQSWCY